MEWSKQTTLKLIDLYRDKPVLWNQTHCDYKNKRKRFAAWADISNELNIDKGELEKKIKNVNSQFLRELKRLKETKTSPDDKYESHWFAFDSLLFLRDKTKLTPSRDDAGVTNNVSQLCFLSISQKKGAECLCIVRYLCCL